MALGLALAILMNASTAGQEPTRPAVADCVDERAIDRIPRCALEAQRSIMRTPGLNKPDASTGEAVFTTESQRQGLYIRARRARFDYEREHAAWQALADTIWQDRLLSTLPLSMGLALTGLLAWIARRRRRAQQHTVVLSAHSLVLDGRELRLAEIETLHLGVENRGTRQLVIRPTHGRTLQLDLDAFAVEVDALEAWLAEVPTAEQRAEERRQIAAMEMHQAQLRR